MSDKQLQLESKLFKGFADKSRLAILKTILTGPKTVSEISDATKLSQPNTSIHLACLLECDLVRKEKKGREVFYRISTKEIKKVIEGAQNILSKYGKEIYKCKTY